jgi:phage tail-like protein
MSELKLNSYENTYVTTGSCNTNKNDGQPSLDSYVENYVTTNRFYVEIGSSIIACFSECSGIGAEIDKQVYLEGGANDQQRIILGHTRFSDVTLKRGITDDATFSNWFSEILNQKIHGEPPKRPETMRRNVNILVFNQAGELMRSWTLVGAIPVAWRTPNLGRRSSSQG